MDPAEEEILRRKITRDLSHLGKIYKAKSSKYHLRSVDHALVEEMLQDGWEEYGQPLKTKTRLRKEKDHATQFEDDVWCQLYKLDYRCFNVSNDFKLPYGKAKHEKKQIDVIAVNDDSILIVECKSSAKPVKAPSFKTEFEALKQRMRGHTKALEQLFSDSRRRIKYVFATRNLRIGGESADAIRLSDAGGFLHNDNAFNYVDSLIKSYKKAARYQFMAILFKGQSISKDRIEVPAIAGKMGGKEYYLFSLEPELLLKMGFILHRTKANEAEMPTYQRLLVPRRLSGITSFIENGGYFPNSVILNFSETTKKIQFQSHSRLSSSRSRTGTLFLPKEYAIAYIIDGQHRIYGYANTKYSSTNTIPVVAFKGLHPSEQLKMFMDINENQKAVSASLRITLEEDLFWNSSRLNSRIKALRSSIIRQLGTDQTSPLFGKIEIGEDKAELKSKPFADSLIRCKLLPAAKGNKFTEEGENTSLYDVNNQDHGSEMYKSKDRVVALLVNSFQFAEKYFEANEDPLTDYIVYNRGTYPFISLIGSLNEFLTGKGELKCSTSNEVRFEAIKKYLAALFDALKNISTEDREYLRGKLGSGAETKWFRMFQNYVNLDFPEYRPDELLDWKERQDQKLQDEGRRLGTEIEKHLKTTVMDNLKIVFGNNWELEIGAIQRQCAERAREQMEKNYKDGLEVSEIPWTDQFFINDYKKIIEKYWGRVPDPRPKGFKTFEEHFALDVGLGFKSKAEKLKWLSFFNDYRRNWAHEGTKEEGLNRQEVNFLQKVHGHFGLTN